MKIQQKVTFIDYGDGYVEGTWGISVPRKGSSGVRGRSKNREKNKQRSERRSKAQLRRISMALGLDHLLTLTYRSNEQDKEKAWHDFETFIRLIHFYIPTWVYLAVIEYQERGAIHFHLGVKGFQDVTLLRALWRRIVKDGNIDVNYIKSKKGYQWKRISIARYLAKYVGKDMETELNERRYRASLGIKIPKVTLYMPFLVKGLKTVQLNAKEYLLEHIRFLAGRIGFIWEPEEGHGQYGWACSWG
jgi:hypothetical protein